MLISMLGYKNCDGYGFVWNLYGDISLCLCISGYFFISFITDNLLQW